MGGRQTQGQKDSKGTTFLQKMSLTPLSYNESLENQGARVLV